MIFPPSFLALKETKMTNIALKDCKLMHFYIQGPTKIKVCPKFREILQFDYIKSGLHVYILSHKLLCLMMKKQMVSKPFSVPACAHLLCTNISELNVTIGVGTVGLSKRGKDEVTGTEKRSEI